RSRGWPTGGASLGRRVPSSLRSCAIPQFGLLSGAVSDSSSLHDVVLRRYYAARAAEYDLGLHHRPEREAGVAGLRELIAPLLSGKTVLDIACGTGQWTRYIAQFASSVVAVDISPEMLNIATSRPPVDGVRFALADAYTLSEELGTFQAAFVSFWISHVPRS